MAVTCFYFIAFILFYIILICHRLFIWFFALLVNLPYSSSLPLPFFLFLFLPQRRTTLYICINRLLFGLPTEIVEEGKAEASKKYITPGLPTYLGIFRI